MVSVSSILTLQLKYKIMYETLEHWKQYKLEKEAKELQKKISKYYELDKLINKLVKKNGVTKY
jgi:hypothetical protein